jgi:hypothetical protein
MKNHSLHDIFQKIWLEKNGPEKPFTSMGNNFLHLLGFEVGYSPVLVNKKNSYRDSSYKKDDKTL